MYYVIRNSPPQIQIWTPRWPPQTAAARNAPGFKSRLKGRDMVTVKQTLW